MIESITHLTVFVSNQDDALEFYTNKLGFELHTDSTFESMRWLTVCPAHQKNFEIALLLAETPAEKALVGKQAAEKPLVSFSTSDCRKTVEELRAQGVKILEEASEAPWGIQALFADLYGNIYHINQEK